MTKPPYKIIEHTADVRIKANGRTLKELFENAAKGMFGIIGGPSTTRFARVRGKQAHRKIEIQKDVQSFEELLVYWLSELLYIFNRDQIIFSSFNIRELEKNRLVAESSGEKIAPENTDLQTEIKAVTFHDLKIEKNNAGFTCKIIFDV
ncbi:MAG: archease [Candidatus Gorgyraea atricola]|nr:archease [Candidatus Gorgyraea atricola]